MFRGSAYALQTDKEICQPINPSIESIKIALIGGPFVGKSSILNCIEHQTFRSEIPRTRSFQLRSKQVRLSNCVINLSVWDGAGDKMQQFIQNNVFTDFDGVVYVFDLSDVQSLLTVGRMQAELQRGDAVEVLAGNKSDLGVSEKTDRLARQFSTQQHMQYIRMSAKENHFITDCFVRLMQEILKKRRIKTSLLVQDQSISKITLEKEQHQELCTQCNYCQIY